MELDGGAGDPQQARNTADRRIAARGLAVRIVGQDGIDRDAYGAECCGVDFNQGFQALSAENFR